MPRATPPRAIPTLAPAQSANPLVSARRVPIATTADPPAGPLWISAADAAAQLGITIEALKKRAKQGLLGFKEGGRWRFSSADLRRYTAGIENRYLRTLPRP